MEWLEELLKNAVVTDGKLDVTALMAAVKKEFPNHAVPKNDFNTVSEAKKKLEADIKERDKQLENLKKETGDAQELQEKMYLSEWLAKGFFGRFVLLALGNHGERKFSVYDGGLHKLC